MNATPRSRRRAAVARPVAVVAVALALGAAGCGGTRSSADATSTTTTTTATATSTATSTSTSTTATTTSSGPDRSGVVDWPTFGGSAARASRSPGGPAPAAIGRQWASATLDGALYGQPLVVGDQVVVATEGDTVYSLSSATGATTWTRNLGTPVPRSALPCGNVDPSGVTGTPVADVASGTLYVVAFVQPVRHDLVALDLATGAVKWRRAIDPPGLDAHVEQERSALTLANGRVYVAFGGLYGDCGPYKGAVVSSATDGTGDLASWTVPTTERGGLWAPSGPAIGADGTLYVAAGNAASTDSAHFDDGNAVIRLSRDLRKLDDWAPSNWAALSQADLDLGSLGPVFAGGHVVIAGKSGRAYLLDPAHLGGVGHEQASVQACGGAFGGAAVNGNRVVIGCADGPTAVDVGDGSSPTITTAWHLAGGRTGSPVIAGDVVWVVTNSGNLMAVDLGSGRQVRSVHLAGSIPGFPTPTVTPSRVVVPVGRQVIALG